MNNISSLQGWYIVDDFECIHLGLLKKVPILVQIRYINMCSKLTATGWILLIHTIKRTSNDVTQTIHIEAITWIKNKH